MKRYIYIRVSSERQSYEQQKECILQYFERHGIDPNIIYSEVQEKVSGTVEHTERELSVLMDNTQPGDIIYISELSRLGRSMTDLFNIVGELSNKGKKEAEAEEKRTGKKQPYGVTIIQCKDGTSIDGNSIGGKALLFAFGLAAEIEVENIRVRTRMAMAAIKRQIEENGYWIAKRSGERRTHLGNIKGDGWYDYSRNKAAEKLLQQSREWRESSPAYQYVKAKIEEGWSNRKILNELQLLEETNPGQFVSREGGKVGPVQLWRWRNEICPRPVKTVGRGKRKFYKDWRERMAANAEKAN